MPTTTTLDGVNGVVTWIVDGDTIEVESDGAELTVRLVGINTPDQGECYAEPALDHLIETLKDREVTLVVSGTDQFGRELAHVYEGSRHINGEMVAMGLALATTPVEDDTIGQALIEAEQTAYDQRVGLWANDACGRGDPVPMVAMDADGSVPDPPGPDDQALEAETLTITNTGPESVDLSGWLLRDESTRHRFTFPTGTFLGPGNSITVTSADNGWSPGSTPVWNNGGDLALLQDPNGTVVARWRY